MPPVTRPLKQHIEDFIEERARAESGYAIAYALMKLAAAQRDLSVNVKYLGNGNASTQMGAIEAFGLHIGDKMDAIADALSGREA